MTVVQCPFCKMDWAAPVLLADNTDGSPALCEGGQCDCGAWWYEGMEDVESD
jgi:hypothetical protein